MANPPKKVTQKTGFDGDGDEFRESAFGASDHVEKRGEGSSHEDEALDHVTPDHSLDSAHRAVDQRDYAHEQDTEVDVDTRHGIQGQRGQEEHDGDPGEHEYTEEGGRDVADGTAEPLFEVLVSRGHAQFAEKRQVEEDDYRDDDQDRHVEHEHAPVGGIGFGRNRKEGDGAQGRSEDTDAGRPPRDTAAALEELFRAVLFVHEIEAHAQHDEQVEGHDRIVDPPERGMFRDPDREDPVAPHTGGGLARRKDYIVSRKHGRSDGGQRFGGSTQPYPRVGDGVVGEDIPGETGVFREGAGQFPAQRIPFGRVVGRSDRPFQGEAA